MNRIIGILVLGVVAATGCNPESPRANGEGDLLAAGIPGAAASEALSDQDSTPMVVRRVWGGPDVNMWRAVSPDGLHLVYVDDAGDLAVRELGSGVARKLTEDASWVSRWAEGAAISPDGKQIAYTWYRDGQENPYELRIVAWEGGSPRVLFRGESYQWHGAEAWSPDGRQILISGSEEDGSHELALVSVADGSARTLKEMGRRWPVEESFSPDGRYLIYDLPEAANSDQRDVFLLDLESGQEFPLVQHPANDFVLGWAPDSENVLFASDRTGTLGAWILPIEDGQAAGEPSLAKPDLWRVSPIGFARDGSFYYGVQMDSRVVYIASLDPETGAVLAAPTAVGRDYLGSNGFPDWSPDGRYLAYTSLKGQRAGWYTGEPVISLRSVETGETRQLRVPDLKTFSGFRWFADGHHLLVPGIARNDRRGVFKVDIHTGEVEALQAFWDIELAGLIGWSPDARSIYYKFWQGDEIRIAVMDLEHASHRVLYDEEADPAVAMSPDGKELAFAIGGGGERSLMLMPAAGGVPQELHRFQTENNYDVLAIAWSVDGRYLLYVRPWNGAFELWRVPVAGGKAEKLDLSASLMLMIRIHPDGRRIAFESGRRGGEIWVMENFLPGRRTESP
jgi:Tol biopolymer transport system component